MLIMSLSWPAFAGNSFGGGSFGAPGGFNGVPGGGFGGIGYNAGAQEVIGAARDVSDLMEQRGYGLSQSELNQVNQLLVQIVQVVANSDGHGDDFDHGPGHGYPPAPPQHFMVCEAFSQVASGQSQTFSESTDRYALEQYRRQAVQSCSQRSGFQYANQCAQSVTCRPL